MNTAMRTTFNVCALAALLLVAVGCRSQDKAGDWTHQTSAAVEYYLAGPQQSAPPDGTLPAGTPLRIISEDGSYTRIAAETDLAGDIEAHIATGAIEPID